MEILYSDENIIVAIKPVGIDSEKGMPEELKNEFGGEIFTVHRLDLNVGGVMVYARNKKSAAELSRAIQDGTMIKEYIACVHGVPDEKGDLEDLLWKDSRKNKVFVVKRMRGGVKKARLEFVRLEKGEISRVRIRLHTGRSHQIRVQFASRGFPLVGDHKYGSRDEKTAPMLYSHKLTFPYKNKTVTFESTPEW
ncbi:MAG: RNA pseudouridine synthase [Clostridia bacterium]|nr:RNA pseudouridine synthase [Clostridia bacterium]